MIKTVTTDQAVWLLVRLLECDSPHADWDEAERIYEHLCKEHNKDDIDAGLREAIRPPESATWHDINISCFLER